MKNSIVATILIALGANLGDRGETVSQAIDELAADPAFSLLGRSNLLATKPVGGPGEQPDFINAASKYETNLSPEEVHQKLIEIEHQHGRIRALRWGARSLDLDLLLYDDVVLETPKLTLPHPRMSFRKFVMQPAAEVAAEMIHPQLGATMGQLWEQLVNSPPVIELATPPGPTAWRLCEEVQKKLGKEVVSIPLTAPHWPDSVQELVDLLEPSPSSIREDAGAVRLLPYWSEISAVMRDTSATTSLSDAPPRLVILWIPAAESIAPQEDTWWSPKAREDLQRRLSEAVQEKVHGPRLCLIGHDMATAITEVTAAVEAVQ